MAPSGTVQASLGRGLLGQFSSIALSNVCGVSSVMGSHFPFLGIDQYYHYFSKP